MSVEYQIAKNDLDKFVKDSKERLKTAEEKIKVLEATVKQLKEDIQKSWSIGGKGNLGHSM